MKKITIILALILVVTSCSQPRTSAPDVIPMPQSYDLQESSFTIDKKSTYAISAPQDIKERLGEYIQNSIGLQADEKAQSNYIKLLLCDSINGINSPEGYKITTNSKGVFL